MKKSKVNTVFSNRESIAVACHNSKIMGNLLHQLKELTNPSCQIIPVSNVQDILSLCQNTKPALVILCCHNLQVLLNELAYQSGPLCPPLLCLQSKYDNQLLVWNRNTPLFTCITEQTELHGYLGLQVRSILQMRQQVTVVKQHETLAEQMMQSHEKEYSKHLSRYVMELDQKVEVLAQVKQRITELYTDVNDHTRSQLMSIVSAIKTSIGDKHLWEDFKTYFEKTNPDFLLLLLEKHPDLTLKDLKYCCYVKMNMSNNDIHNLLGINQESVRTHKYRLKKKLELNQDSDLQSYLNSFGRKERVRAVGHFN